MLYFSFLSEIHFFFFRYTNQRAIINEGNETKENRQKVPENVVKKWKIIHTNRTTQTTIEIVLVPDPKAPSIMELEPDQIHTSRLFDNSEWN